MTTITTTTTHVPHVDEIRFTLSEETCYYFKSGAFFRTEELETRDDRDDAVEHLIALVEQYGAPSSLKVHRQTERNARVSLWRDREAKAVIMSMLECGE